MCVCGADVHSRPAECWTALLCPTRAAEEASGLASLLRCLNYSNLLLNILQNGCWNTKDRSIEARLAYAAERCLSHTTSAS